MRDSKPTRQNRSASPKGVPYFGLGFAMQNAIERSRRMVLKRAGAQEGRAEERRIREHGS